MLVFTPDRLSVVKGAPAVRRAYFDRALGRGGGRRERRCTAEYASRAGPKGNAALRRVAAGLSIFARKPLAPWTERLRHRSGRCWSRARRELLDEFTPALSRSVQFELGLDGGHKIALRRRATVTQSCSKRGPRPRRRPRFDRCRSTPRRCQDQRPAPRELRSFGSQGEQRLAVLALLLAESVS